MASTVITCWQCVESVPAGSPWCPNCGADLLNPRRRAKRRRSIFDWGPKVLLWIGGAVVFALLVRVLLLDGDRGSGSPATEDGGLPAMALEGSPGSATPRTLTLEPTVGPTKAAATPTDPARPAGDLATDAVGTLRVTGDAVAIAAGAIVGENGFTDGATIQVILDTSGSMQDPLQGSTRIEIAKRVLTGLVSADLPAGTPLMMRTYGAAGDACDTSLSMPLEPLDPAAMTRAIAAVEAANGYTPLAESIRDATRDLRKLDGPKIVVLLTDGLETCDGDPKAAVRALVRQVPDAHLNIIGFGIEDPDFKRDMRAWAKIGKGSYFDATDEASLDRAVQAAVQPPFRVVDGRGNEVASGTVGGSPIELPAGTYRVEVQITGDPVIAGVVVQAGGITEVDLRDAAPATATPTPDG